ncbi:MAG: spermidine/putrescine ABC transporter substrate-binding protein [Ilumatobacter sp.]|uniref:ABC transporter substrate-binding protein n=2 Tax=Ilumatobacter sp. TaxID=1967498 RepID=UPI0032988C82
MTTPNNDFSRMAMSRRRLLARAGAIGAAGMSLPALLAACGGSDGDGDASPTSDGGSGTQPEGSGAPVAGGGGNSLLFENWPEYVDPTEDDLTGTVDRFMAETGIDMNYTETYNDNVEYFAKIQPLLGTGKTIDPDIIAPTSWLVGRLISLGWLDKLPIDQVPNVANLRPDLMNPSWDPTGEYSLPWQTGFAGIAYNIDATGRELTSTADLFDPEFNGKIGMLTEMRDTMGLLMLAEGVDISTVSTFDAAASAFEKLEAAKNDGQIRRFTGNDYLNDLSTGNFAACVGWSGDVVQLAIENPSIRFVIPEEGGTSWADAMVMPKGAVNRDAAAQWMNFCYDPVQAAQITAWVQYVSPVAGVQAELEKIDPELAVNPLLFPDDETVARTFAFANLAEDVEAEYDARFAEITGA